MPETRTTCPYCGVGCGVLARTDHDTLVAVAGDTRHPANGGRLCVKGTALAETQVARGRLLDPEVDGVATDWDRALDVISTRLRETITAFGPRSVAMYLSGQLLTEDYYVANKFMKGFVGSPHVDTNSRLCMSSAVAAHKRAFGEDIVACEYADVDAADLIVLVGSNAAWAHPVLYQRIAQRRQAGARVVVIDPRRTATCEIADLHLALRPGSDAALFNGLLCHLSRAGAVDGAFVDRHTTGYEAALDAARSDAGALAERTGLPPGDLACFLDWFAATPATLTLFSQGVNQASNGTDKGSAIINCHLATGRIGRAGAGPFSITGQPNAMGGREVGGLANQLSAHMEFAPEHVDRVRRYWNAPAVVDGPGHKAVDLFEAVHAGEIRAIWIMGTNPVVSLPRSARVAKALERCPLVIVSDCVADTETLRLADVRLPAAGWGEKDGTVTNSERCLSRQRAFLPVPGRARPDWWAISRVAAHLGHADAFDYTGPAQIFREHAALTGFENRGERMLDLSALAALSDDAWDRMRPRTWPLDGRRPFADGCFPTADGRARFAAVAPHEAVQQPTRRFPFVLNTGRLRDQWHSMTRTGQAPRLFGHTDEPTIALAPADAERLDVRAGELVKIHNEQGRVRGIAVLDPGLRPGELFAPIHWNGMFSWPSRVGDLVAAVTDPVSGQPETKHAVVALTTVACGPWLRLACRAPLEPAGSDALLFRVRLPAEGGWRHEFALAPGTDAGAWMEWLLRTHGVPVRDADDVEMVHYQDAETGEQRWLLVDRDGVRAIGFAAMERDTLPALELVAGSLEADSPVRWQLLAGVPVGDVDCSRPVCTCMEVREAPIRAAIDAGCTSVAALGAELGCGTRCGSCIPELTALLGAAQTRGAA